MSNNAEIFSQWTTVDTLAHYTICHCPWQLPGQSSEQTTGQQRIYQTLVSYCKGVCDSASFPEPL